MPDDLHHKYPHLNFPMRCEKGCGTVLEIVDAFRSYERDHNGKPMLICQCCAAEYGHIDEDLEEGPEDAPVCKRQPKKPLRISHA